MKRISVLSFIFLMGIFPFIYAQKDYSAIIGTWEGFLKLPTGDSLSIVLSVEPSDDSVHVEMDSPDQYTYGIAVSNFSFNENSVHFTSSPSISFKGTLIDSLRQISGDFTQFGRKFDLSFAEIPARKKLSRPQTPQPPFDYFIDDKIVINDKEKGRPVITGTLTAPKDSLPKALLILISGSGWQDRDETIMGHKPFWVIADYLTRQGYAVFRYDDLPQAIFVNSTTLDFVDYVNLIIEFLKEKSEFNTIPIGLLGHSEGALVACITAAENKEIDFVISMGGVAQPFKDILLSQAKISAKMSGFSQEEIEQTLNMSKEIYDVMEKAKDRDAAMKKINGLYDQWTNGMSDLQKERYNLTDKAIFSMKQTLYSPWFFSIFKLKPEKYLRKIKCPVYAMNGEKDSQVPAENVWLIQKYLKQNPLNRFDIFPGLNHLFQEATTGLWDEYGDIEQTISPVVLENILEWLENRSLKP